MRALLKLSRDKTEVEINEESVECKRSLEDGVAGESSFSTGEVAVEYSCCSQTAADATF